jgi:fibronectin type 3 domain-containing protein
MSKHATLVVIALVATLGFVGCTESNKVTSPVGDTVPPAAVLELDGTVVDGAVPQVSLSWKTGPELDLDGYKVYRSINGQAAQLVATTSAAHWRDKAVTKDSQYTYEVSAVDLSANESPRVSTTLKVPGTPTSHGQNIN